MTADNKKEAYDRWVVQNNYYHKKFSIYGDSISTLAGYQPPEYRVFYEGEHCSQSGIYKMKDTWWGKVIDFFSGELLVNNSYSGCRVSKLPDNLSSNTDFFPSGCSQKRIQQLGMDTQAPDVIIIYMGTNDYGFGVPVAAPPSALPTEEHLDFFENAYLFMLQNIRMKYPNCEIWCCTLCPGRVQGSVYSTFPYRVGKNFFRDFNQVIQNAANLHNCRLIDFPSFSKDYEAIDGTHPTKKGMSQLAEMVIRSVSPEAVRFLSDDENIGKIVCGKYRIEDTIHRSTAPLYLGTSIETGQKYAIKVIDCSRVSGGKNDMLALTQAHLHLTHPAFQQIIDYCEEGEYLFQILKYTPGFSLSILLERNKKPLSVDFVVDCAKQIADALSYIFSFPEPIIDCSLAPHNLVLDKTGQIHIMDFFCPTPVLTEDYTCILQMGYSAPERFSGMEYADVRTYIYELGMVMHYLLTGIDPRKPPYFIPFTENQLPKGMEYIIKKCTVKDPGARYQNCDELIADLNQYKDLPKPKNFFQKLFRKS